MSTPIFYINPRWIDDKKIRPAEQAYYLRLKWATDDNMKYNPAKDEKGNPIKGTGARHIINNIIRIKTLKGEFLVTDGKLIGYDHIGNKIERTPGTTCSENF